METKFILKSKTLQGVLGMLMPLLLPLLGVQFDDAQTQEIVQALGVLSGAAWAVYGRLSAKGGIHITRPRYGGYATWGLVLPMCCAVALALAVSACAAGCAIKRTSDQVVVAAVATGETYAALHDRYLELDRTLPPESRAVLHMAAPYMDAAKHWIVAGQTAVIVAGLASTPQSDFAAIVPELHGLVNDLARAAPDLSETDVQTAHGAVDMLANGAAALPGVLQVVGNLARGDGAAVSITSAVDLVALVMGRSNAVFANALALVAEAATATGGK